MREFPDYLRFLGDVPSDVRELLHSVADGRLGANDADGVRWLLGAVFDLNERIGRATDAYDRLSDKATEWRNRDCRCWPTSPVCSHCRGILREVKGD